jgi:L-iditol 2-dehydrogenase
MKAAVLKSPGILELEDLPDPQCPEGGALIRIVACAICGTDVKMLLHGHRDLVYPRVLGHEVVGRVAEIDGDCCISEGDQVQVWPGIPCGRCSPCLRGKDNRCKEIKILGFNSDGAFAEMLALPQESMPRGLNPVPAGCDPGLIALAEPLACCLNGQEMVGVSPGDTVLVLGGGPIGCLHALLAERLGVERIIVVEKLEHRARRLREHTSEENTRALVIDSSFSLARAVSEETEGRGVDVILTATPEIRVDSQLLKLLSPGGRISVFSGPRPEDSEVQIDLRGIHYRELTVSGAYGCSSRQNRVAVGLLASGEIRADWIVTKRTSLDSITDAFVHSSERLGLKSVICMD